MVAFGAEREAVQAAGLADGAKTVFAAGQQLVDIDLMAHVPDELVLGRGEYLVQGDGEFHHAQVGAEVAAALGQTLDQFRADFAGQFLQLRHRELFDVLGRIHHVQITAHKIMTALNS